MLAELRTGSETAFRKLVDDNVHQVTNLCYRFVQNRKDAEDLAQDTFTEVYFALSKFRGDSALSTWIHQIAVRKSLDHLRSQSRQKRKGYLTRLFTGDRDDHDDPGIDLPSTSNPEEEVELAECRFVLQSALEKLPKNQHIAFVLSKMDGLSYEEIAQILETTVSSVTSLIHRAKKSLYSDLKHYYLTSDKGL